MSARRGFVRSGRGLSSGRADSPFRYLGGDASLDFVNTVDWKARGTSSERLLDYERLTRWAQGAGILTDGSAERLRRIARSHPKKAKAALAEALRLRSVLHQLYRSVAAGNRRTAVWEDFNDLLAGSLHLLQVKPRDESRGAEWGWRGSVDSLVAMLPPVLWSAARLLTSDEALRVRVCAGPECGWMYVDRSRNRLRRWCDMRTCGTEEKSRRRRERHRSSRYKRRHGPRA